jgi:hypothetical protein
LGGDLQVDRVNVRLGLLLGHVGWSLKGRSGNDQRWQDGPRPRLRTQRAGAAGSWCRSPCRVSRHWRAPDHGPRGRPEGRARQRRSGTGGGLAWVRVLARACAWGSVPMPPCGIRPGRDPAGEDPPTASPALIIATSVRASLTIESGRRKGGPTSPTDVWSLESCSFESRGKTCVAARLERALSKACSFVPRPPPSVSQAREQSAGRQHHERPALKQGPGLLRL